MNSNTKMTMTREQKQARKDGIRAIRIIRETPPYRRVDAMILLADVAAGSNAGLPAGLVANAFARVTLMGF